MAGVWRRDLSGLAPRLRGNPLGWSGTRVTRVEVRQVQTQGQVWNVRSSTASFRLPSISEPVRAGFATEASGDNASGANGGKPANGAKAGAATGGAAADANAVEQQLANRVVELEKEVEKLKNDYVYSLAERENLRRILRKEADDNKVYGMRNMATDLLNLSDDFERALKAVPEEAKRMEEVKTILDGVLMMEKSLKKVFDKYGVTTFNPMGEKFDPNKHFGMMEVVETDVPRGHIAVVIQNGYAMHDKVLRAAMVGISKKA